MKIRLIIVFYVICLLGHAQQPGAYPQALKQISNSIFTVYTYNLDGKMLATGSGFVISSNGLCVTNFHVLENAYTAFVKMKNGEKIKIRNVVDFNADADLVKFQLDVPSYRTFYPLKLSTALPTQGEDVINISTPLGVLEQTLSKGNVSSIRKMRDYDYLIQITAPISQGSSGSPILNMRGEVIGVATLMMKYGQNLNFAVTSLKLVQMKKVRNVSLLDMSKDPLNTRYIKMARYAITQKNLDKAIDLIATELRKNQNNHLAWNMMGDIHYYLKDDFTNSVEYYKRAYDISPNYDNSLGYGLSIAAIGKAKGGDKDDFRLAYNLFNSLAQKKPTPFIYYIIGDLLYEYTVIYKQFSPGKLQSALDALDYSLSLDKSDVAFIKRAEVKAAMNDVGSALVDYENAIKIDPLYYKAYYLRGKLRAFHLGNLESGLEDEEKALRLVGTTNEKAEILAVQALIYYQLARKTGNKSFVSSSLERIEEAYLLTGNESYMDYKQEIMNGSSKSDLNKKSK